MAAAFDFDGTLTRVDTLIPFLLYFAGPLAFVRRIAAEAPTLLLYALGRLRNDVAKERILARFLAGVPLETLREAGAAYAARGLPRLLRPAGMRRLAWHRERGHRCVLVSASLDLYLAPWAKAAGFDDLVCSSLALQGGLPTGRLAGGNCYGPEKLARLRERLGPLEGWELYAYGDSRGDRELLAAAAHPYYRAFPESA